ncbi:MAG: hypothetical protein JNJ70_14340 [Verrucomicrobiales bacterium]|nr:hypothetical protein [Verrucomicrobiales bacterium]
MKPSFGLARLRSLDCPRCRAVAGEPIRWFEPSREETTFAKAEVVGTTGLMVSLRETLLRHGSPLLALSVRYRAVAGEPASLVQIQS